MFEKQKTADEYLTHVRKSPLAPIPEGSKELLVTLTQQCWARASQFR